MTTAEIESRADLLKAELEKLLEELQRDSADEASERRRSVGKILLELGALQMRLTDADRR